MKKLSVAVLSALSAAFLPAVLIPQVYDDSLSQSFVHPPESARLWVYWFWLNGNITEDGITRDLEAMKRVGIGGVLIMEVDQGTPAGPVGEHERRCWLEREWGTVDYTGAFDAEAGVD